MYSYAYRMDIGLSLSMYHVWTMPAYLNSNILLIVQLADHFIYDDD